jgi:hypothetical protein
MKQIAFISILSLHLTSCAFITAQEPIEFSPPPRYNDRDVAIENALRGNIYYHLEAQYFGAGQPEMEGFQQRLPELHPLKRSEVISYDGMCLADFGIDRGKNSVAISSFLSANGARPKKEDWVLGYYLALDRGQGKNCQFSGPAWLTPNLKYDATPLTQMVQAGVTNTADLPVEEAFKIISKFTSIVTNKLEPAGLAPEAIEKAGSVVGSKVNQYLSLSSVQQGGFPVSLLPNSNKRFAIPLAFYEKSDTPPKFAGAVVIKIVPVATVMKDVSLDLDGLPIYNGKQVKFLEAPDLQLLFADFQLRAKSATTAGWLNDICNQAIKNFDGKFSEFDLAFIIYSILIANQNFNARDPDFWNIESFNRFRNNLDRIRN